MQSANHFYYCEIDPTARLGYNQERFKPAHNLRIGIRYQVSDLDYLPDT